MLLISVVLTEASRVEIWTSIGVVWFARCESVAGFVPACLFEVR